jgi:hypothetical protein
MWMGSLHFLDARNYFPFMWHHIPEEQRPDNGNVSRTDILSYDEQHIQNM